MELQYQITKEQLIVPMPKEVDHHIAKTISREIDFLIDSWHVRKLIFAGQATSKGERFFELHGFGGLVRHSVKGRRVIRDEVVVELVDDL